MGVSRLIRAAGAKGARRQARAHIGRLGDNVLTKRVTANYSKFAARFSQWAFGSSECPSISSYVRLDQLCSEYIEQLWGEGEPKGWASTTLAAVQHFVPGARHHLPSAWRLKSAWDKHELPVRAPPLSVDVVLGISGVMISVGHPRSALAVALAFHGLLRTGEVGLLQSVNAVGAEFVAKFSLRQQNVDNAFASFLQTTSMPSMQRGRLHVLCTFLKLLMLRKWLPQQ